MKVNNEFADGDFYFLERFLKVIDNELSQINLQIKASSDPDSDGLCDLGEYFLGYGFVAIQRYISSTYPQTGKGKYNIYKHGLNLNDDIFLIEVINAGANYWKHHDEWYSTEEKTKKLKSNLDSDISRVLNRIEKITPYADYTLSNLLAELLDKHTNSKELLFSPLLPLIKDWREDLDKHAKLE